MIGLKYTSWVVLLSAMTASSAVLGETVFDEELSLDVAFELAKSNAPVLAIARYQVDIAEAQRDDARGRLLPSVSLFGQWSENKLSYEGGVGGLYSEQNYPGERYGAQLTQPLLNKTNWNEFSRQKLLFGIAENDFAQAEIDLLRQLVVQYLDVLVSQSQEVALKEELQALSEQLDQANAFFERSMIPITELYETRAREQSVRADVIAARAESEIARQELKTLIGDVPGTLATLDDHLSLPVEAASFERIAELALNNTPAVRAAETAVAAALEGVEREKGARWPQIDLIVSQQYSDVGFDNLSQPARTSDSIQIAVNYPLVQGGSTSARIRGAWAELFKTKEQLRQIRRDVEAEARYSLVSLEAAVERCEAAERSLTASEMSVAATQKAKLLGEAGAVEVLFALSQRSKARRDLAIAQQQQVLAWLDLQLMAEPDPSSVARKLASALWG
ncbi:TolC family protein [Luminiphilus sp.]|nr:TolC family protein [Luminiphilus sp.]